MQWPLILIIFPQETLPAVAGLRPSILRRLALCVPWRTFAVKLFIVN